ncbi:MAG: phosphate ABC transporter permease PstA [Nitrospirae bacterium]|nr:phosphate ABC transporter permease PstA [Nitrospirota bacterium]MBI5694637.1 phosphate ABC transporter permease PstA [Nitrospirota bacterium]
MMAGSLVAACIAVALLFWIIGYVFIKGIHGINLDFFTELPTPVGVEGGGLANAIVGSIIVVGMAALMAVPVGVAAAVYLSEYGRGLFASSVRFVADVLAGVPAIVAGIVAYALVVSRMGRFSAFSGSVALAILMLPIIIRSSEEIFKTVPNTLREASLALGIPRWRTVIKVVLRTASGGLVTGIMLAVARVGGEAAPLLFTAFSNSFWSLRPDQPMATLPVQLFNYAISPYDDWHEKAWAAALVLIFMVLMLNIAAKMYAHRRPGR